MAILNLGSALTLLTSLGIAYILASTLYQWQRLRHIPGPPIASFSYAWLVYCGYTATRARGWYDGARFHPGHDTMFTTIDPARHDRLKARLAHGYSGRETPGLEEAIDEQVAHLVDLLRRKYVFDPKTAGGTTTMLPLDLSKVFPLFTLDTIARIALDKEFGCLEADRDVKEFYHVVEEFIPLLNVFADVPWVRKIVYSPLMIKLFGSEPTDKSGLGLAMKMVNEETARKYNSDNTQSGDIMTSFRRHGITQEECQTEALFMFVAGSETTATAMRIVLYYLTSTPRAYHALKKEIRQAIVDGRASSPITDREARGLPYLQAVIYEGMRIRPVATGTFGKVVPPGGDTINGYWVPGGTSVGPNQPSVMRSKALWGPDADLFRPERFIEVDEVRRAEMQRIVDVNFGYGRWMCAGKAIALLELNKAIFELLREFDFQVLDPKSGFKGRSHGSWIDHGMYVGVMNTDMFG
ncbi:cytochrome P450 [Xylariaceae sp. FL0594]|nr:cytochrome P450 [Xylariaceae sp. FL0594]